MREQLLNAVSLIRSKRPPSIPADYTEEFLYAAWTLAAQDANLAGELAVEAERYVLGHSLRKLSNHYAWNGQYWGYTKVVAEALFGVSYVAFINPHVVDQKGASKKHSHKSFSDLAARLGRDMAEFFLGYDLLLSNTVSFEAGERLNALLHDRLGYGRLPDVTEYVEDVDHSSDLSQNEFFDIGMTTFKGAPTQKVMTLNIDGQICRTSFWKDTDVEYKPFEADLELTKVSDWVLSKLVFKRASHKPARAEVLADHQLAQLRIDRDAAQSEGPQPYTSRDLARDLRIEDLEKGRFTPLFDELEGAKTQVFQNHKVTWYGFFVFCRLVFAAVRREQLYGYSKVAYESQEDVRNARQAENKRTFTPVPAAKQLEATFKAERERFQNATFPLSAFTLKPDLSKRDWRDEVKITKVLRLWREKSQEDEEFGNVKCPPELGQKVSDKVIVIAKHLHGSFEGRLFEDVLTDLKVSYDIVENSEIRRIRAGVQTSQLAAEKAGRKLGAQYLGQLCMVAAHLIHDRDDMSRHLELEYDENECLDYAQLDAGEASATFLGQWLWQARLEKQFGHLSCPQVQHALRAEFDLDFSDELGASKEALFEAAANTLFMRVKGPLNSADFAPFGLSELCDDYCKALRTERRLDSLRELQASRESLFNVESVIAKSPDHEELEKLVQSERRLPKGVVGQLAQHRVRHTQVCNDLTGIGRVPAKERVVQLQNAVACYHRKAPQGLIAQLANARLSASL